MILHRSILFLILILEGLFSVSVGQQSISLQTEEINLGEKIDIPVLSSAAREALIKEGYRIAGSENDQSYILYLKISTRQGSESQGIFTSFADVYIALKSKDEKIIGEKSVIGLKGAGLSFEHAGLDAVKKSTGKVLPEILQVLNDHRKELTITASLENPVTDRPKGVDGTPPEILISSPLLFRNAVVETRSPKIQIEGKVTDASEISKITINDMPVNISTAGIFTAEISVDEGITQILVIAEDQYHNQSSKIFSVSRSDETQTEQVIPSDLKSGPGNYLALIIGINDYEDPGITSLDNPITDAEVLYETVTRYYTFDKGNVTFLKNPDRDQIIIALDMLSKKITESDNLLIFYAGHGIWDNKRKLGYWLPSDARISNPANWILNSTIKDMIAGIHSKHTLLIADACFSGSIIFKTRKAFNDAPPSVEKLYELPSRKAMTSGTMTEVPDKSVFLEYLNKRLLENKQTYLSSEQLFTSFREAVMNNSPNTPQYGIIQDTGDEGGDFIFIKRVLN